MKNSLKKGLPQTEILLNKEPRRNMHYTQLSYERYSSHQLLMKQMYQEKVIAVSSRFPKPATVERRMFLFYILIRQSLLATLCIALYLLTASHATVPDQDVYKVQMTPRIPATQEQAFDIRSAASVPVQVCPTNPNEPHKIGEVNWRSKSQTTMRDPPQPVKQRIRKQSPPMTSPFSS